MEKDGEKEKENGGVKEQEAEDGDDLSNLQLATKKCEEDTGALNESESKLCQTFLTMRTKRKPWRISPSASSNTRRSCTWTPPTLTRRSWTSSRSLFLSNTATSPWPWSNHV